MNCHDVEAEARAAVAGLPNVTVTSIIGEELLAAGLNAIYTVGRTSLVVLKLTPTGARTMVVKNSFFLLYFCFRLIQTTTDPVAAAACVLN